MAHVQKRSYRSARTGKVTSSWQARYTAPDGRERTKRFDRKVDAERWLDTNGADIARGQWVDPDSGRITLKEYAEAWQAAQIHRPTTAAQVASHLTNHIYPMFGDRALSSIRPSEVQAWVRGRSDTLQPATVEVVFRYLAAIFKAALSDRILAFSPCNGVRLPTVQRTQVVPLETEQVMALLNSMPATWRATVAIAAGVGMRQGEILGLTVNRVDFL